MSVGWHRGLAGPFAVYRSPAPDVVRHEHASSACLLTDRDGKCGIEVDAMRRKAFSGPRSLGNIREIAQAWEKASKRVRLT